MKFPRRRYAQPKVFHESLSTFPQPCSMCHHTGNVEKSHQRRSCYFAVLTYRSYAPLVKKAAALLDGLF